LKYPVIYIKGKGSHTARFSEMVEGRMYVVGDIGSAMRTLTSLRTDHAFILYEQRDPAADLSDIRLLNSWPGGGIVLITSRELTERERREYLRAGVNSAIAGDMPRKDFLRMLQFMGDYAFTHKPVAQNSPEVQIFRMPLWKRTFDIAASLSAILLLSPLLIVVAAAIILDTRALVLLPSCFLLMLRYYRKKCQILMTVIYQTMFVPFGTVMNAACLHCLIGAVIQHLSPSRLYEDDLARSFMSVKPYSSSGDQFSEHDLVIIVGKHSGGSLFFSAFKIRYD